MATTSNNLLSTSLPQRLLNFLARYPPHLYAVRYTKEQIPLTRPKKSDFLNSDSPRYASVKSPAPASATISASESAPASAPAASQSASNVEDAQTVASTTPPPSSPSSSSSTDSESSETLQSFPPNPFRPWRNPTTGCWRSPVYSLRRQAGLFKLAKAHGVESLLPASRKSTAFKEARTLEKGLRVKGTGVGQKVKGHKWERKMPAKLEQRRQAMEEMPELIKKWKQVSSEIGSAVALLLLKQSSHLFFLSSFFFQPTTMLTMAAWGGAICFSWVMEEDGRNIPRDRLLFLLSCLLCTSMRRIRCRPRLRQPSTTDLPIYKSTFKSISPPFYIFSSLNKCIRLNSRKH